MAAGTARRGPLVLVVLGVLLMLGAATALVVALVTYGGRAAESVAEAADLRDDLLAEVVVPGRVRVDLDGGADYQLTAFGRDLVAERDPFGGDDRLVTRPFPRPDVTVTAPDGSTVAVSDPSWEVRSTTGGEDAVAIADLEVAESGTYTVTVRGDGDRVRSIGVTPGLDLGETAGALVTGGLLALAALVAGGTGFLLLLAGVIWWAAGRSTQTVSTAAPPPPPFLPPGPPG